MIRYTSASQLSLEGFAPFCDSLNKNNRWIVLGMALPWDEMASVYYRSMDSGNGRPSLDARRAIGALIIKHRIGLDDRGTVQAIQENPYLQWFCGLSAFSHEPIFDPSLFVSMRKRMGVEEFDQMTCSMVSKMKQAESEQKDNSDSDAAQTDEDDIGQDEQRKPNDSKDSQAVLPPTHKGMLLMDATVAPQDIAYPTDLGLLNKGRMRLEEIIDELCQLIKCSKPRSYRKVARKQFLEVSRQRRPSKKVIRKGIRRQLNYIRRDLRHIDVLLDRCGTRWPLTRSHQRDLWVINLLHRQQRYMYDGKLHSVAGRIVSIHEPHVRPIVRGKARAKVEFGAKICVSLCDGISRLDYLEWDAYNESSTLIPQVERYRQLHGHYPESVNADGIYGTRKNRKWLKERDIKYIGKPLGRPSTVDRTPEAKRRLKQEMTERNAIEGKFGQAKIAYGMGLVKARLSNTSASWIAASLFITNLIRWEKVLITKALSYAYIFGLYRHTSKLTLARIALSATQYLIGQYHKDNPMTCFANSSTIPITNFVKG